MAFTGAPFPSRQPPLGSDGFFTRPLLIWFRDLRASLDATPSVVPDGTVHLTGKTATIATTPIPTGSLAAGLYRVNYVIRVTTAAGVTSAFTVTITWTRGGVTQTWTGVLKNGNTTTTYESSGPPLIHIDAATPISYAVLYASNPAAAMVYEFDLTLQVVSED